jgi:hypothetical protein
MMSDRALTDQASVVAAVRVVSADPAPANRAVATDYQVEVERVLKGSLPGSTVVVRVLGGVGADGVGLKIWGAPTFRQDERAILFLEPADDGTYGILHLMLGSFLERSTLDGRKAAVRDLSEAHALGNPGPDPYRDFATFSAWILDRGLGIERPADYYLPMGTTVVRPALEKFAFLVDAQGAADRWFRFDQGRNVEWRVFEGGQPGMTLQETIDSFKVSLKAWNDDPRTDVRYDYVGTTSADAAFTRFDGVNTIIFNDPHRGKPLDVPGSFNCSSGGVVGIGGPWYFTETQIYGDYLVHESVEADVITNDGTECLFARTGRNVAEEVFAHELGHTLGLGHTSDTDAIMFATVHDDRRGAALKPDDYDGLAEFYSVQGPTPKKAPAAPSKLAIRATASNRVTLSWRDRAKDEGGFMIEARIGKKGAFKEVGSVPKNTTSIPQTGLVPTETYSFRLRSYNRKGFSTYSNTVTIKMPR